MGIVARRVVRQVRWWLCCTLPWHRDFALFASSGPWDGVVCRCRRKYAINHDSRTVLQIFSADTKGETGGMR